ncbi:MAG TPA: YggT family protein [Pyrinomonadaceae bacterium]|nr:YggT family protein [Pyrinomonadaceae bacterium]
MTPTIFDDLSYYITYAVAVVITGVIVLILLRFILNYTDANPFSRPVLAVRRMTDPLIMPVRRALVGFGVDPKAAPLIAILLAILVGWFMVQLTDSILGTAKGVTLSLQARRFIPLVGFILYGALDIYAILIFIRIIFSWGMVSYSNRVMRFLVNVTDPLLVPLRRMIPPFGMLDLSPIVAFILIWLFKAAIAGTLLRA